MGQVGAERREHVEIVEFSSGPSNYFTAELLHEVADVLEHAHSTGARAAVLRSAGKHFCAGADFSSIGSSVDARGEVADRTYEAALRLFRQPLPLVAAVQGAAIGGGLGLACVADLRVVTHTTRLEANFTRLGFHPGFGLSAVLPHIVGPHAALVMLTGSRRVDGVEAVDMGLADLLREPEQLLDGALELATRLADGAPLAVQAVRSTLRRALLREVEEALAAEASEQRRLWATEDAAIGMAAARRHETPLFVGR